MWLVKPILAGLLLVDIFSSDWHQVVIRCTEVYSTAITGCTVLFNLTWAIKANTDEEINGTGSVENGRTSLNQLMVQAKICRWGLNPLLATQSKVNCKLGTHEHETKINIPQSLTALKFCCKSQKYVWCSNQKLNVGPDLPRHSHPFKLDVITLKGGFTENK